MTQTAHEPIDLLFTLDEAYLPRLEVVVASLHATNPGVSFRIHVLHRSIPEERLADFAAHAATVGFEVVSQLVDETLFEDAPTTDRYPEEMYYRLLAGELLPRDLHRVLYIDPDVLIINPLRDLWDTDLDGNVFAAAAHDSTPGSDAIEDVNNVRLGTEGSYFNSGVLLMDLDAAREMVDPQEVFDYTRESFLPLLLPDQDVLNALYSQNILEVDELRWNYDARTYGVYLMASGGEADEDWVMQHTSILHFCGRQKPWKPNYPYRFGVLYKHYEQQAARIF